MLLATGGCAATGTFFDPTAEIKAAVAEALDDLAGQPALHITGSVNLTTGLERFNGYDATVLADGTAWSTFDDEDQSGAMISLEGTMHLKLDDARWIGMEYGPAAAEELGNGWVRVPTEHWHDPGTYFRPDRFAELLRTGMTEDGSLEIPLPTPETIDGVEVYRIDHESGSLNVTAEAPHRFVSVDELSLFSRDLVTSAVTIGEFSVEPATDEHVDDLGSHLLDTLPTMDRPYSLTAWPQVDSSDLRAECAYPVGCAVGLDVEVTATADDPYTDDLLVIFNAEVYSEATEKVVASCEKTRSILRDKKTSMSCTAKPDSGFNGSVYILGWADAIGQYTYDTKAAIEYVTDAVAEVTGD
ncbi:hypothetical protein ACFQ3B_15230 [Stackebrandtia endophytica]|nr:hypothetical protein [Stackebrandtia endophytica]